ncbi:hypothetical protein FA15DRAFT_698410 [Coprinopsis marcescibilis]|uniref:Uncharacterized protein n=1 Tax=Coprinopsis marcescibilis TaxID=230819 RepID=A0A5C3KCM9_COPMA|nr:hypothetical protein FA15DRAFT_698410 [Coprinopsis marcescibilis]
MFGNVTINECMEHTIARQGVKSSGGLKGHEPLQLVLDYDLPRQVAAYMDLLGKPRLHRRQQLAPLAHIRADIRLSSTSPTLSDTATPSPVCTFPSPLAIPSAPSILYGSHSVINISNECEGFSAAVVWSSSSSCKDSLLATLLVLDLSILAELLTCVNYCKVGEAEFKPYPPLGSISYLSTIEPGTEVINTFNRQSNTLEIFFKACLGLEGSSNLLLETRLG